MNIILKNEEIYTYTENLIREFSDNEIKLPIKVNFYLQKNKNILIELAQEIEEQRIQIIKEYGIFNAETQKIEIPQDKKEEASKKINELFELTQEVNIYKINLEAFGDISLTFGQTQALLFMIDEGE